ncbi:MAG: phosphoenolpyruvate--protein phosphotransferase [Synergistaceae bacterium]|jgi:phosphotransferase system enzyme I (PtsI)|nr:phosphoenolpyruvate--protein phosphotransferase [Synergistaceae bacterium]
MKLPGIPVSGGIVIGEVFRYEPFQAAPEISPIEKADVERNIEIYVEARSAARREMEEAQNRVMERAPDKAGILSAHMEILMDPVIDEEVRGMVCSDLLSADAAIASVFDKYSALLRKSKSASMRERASDLQDVKNRLLRCWAGVGERNLSSLEKPVIVVCDDLYPSDTVSIDRDNVLGIITQVGGTTSHTAIIARGYEIPAVLGVQDCMSLIRDGDTVVLDAENGEILLAPGDDEREAYAAKRESMSALSMEMRTWRGVEPVTRDGRRIWVGMNISGVSDYELAGAVCADGVGLFRTEFIYLGSDRIPDEDEQYRIYRKALDAFRGKPLIMRTLDIGGDKQLERFNLQSENNPFLGLRGLRLCFARPELFGAQIRAALRASAHGDLRLMLPMVSSLDEIQRAKEFIAEQGAKLDADGIAWNCCIKIGIMVEIPSIALIADLVAPYVDFVSIGTNDLCQYLNAADRLNPAVESCYQEYHPAMFRILGMIARGFAGADRTVGICGEIGGDPLAIPALLGLGIEKFSMCSASIAAAKRAICGLDMSDAVSLAQEVQQMKTESEVRARLQAFADNQPTLRGILEEGTSCIQKKFT